MSSSLKWFVVMTKPGRQDDVAVRLNGAGFTAFNPKLNQYSKKRSQYIVQPLFPLYLFVKMDIEEHFRMINYTRGVLRILGIGKTPHPISEVIIDKIKSSCDDQNVIKAKYSVEEIKEGDSIRITNGPLEGLEAVVSGLYNEKQRIEILLDLMRISIDQKHVTKIN